MIGVVVAQKVVVVRVLVKLYHADVGLLVKVLELVRERYYLIVYTNIKSKVRA